MDLSDLVVVGIAGVLAYVLWQHMQPSASAQQLTVAPVSTVSQVNGQPCMTAAQLAQQAAISATGSQLGLGPTGVWQNGQCVQGPALVIPGFFGAPA